MKRTSYAMLAMAWVAYSSLVSAQNAVPINPAAANKAVELCSTCHGPYGISTSPDFPILAAQREGYLEAQIDAFRSHNAGGEGRPRHHVGDRRQSRPRHHQGDRQYYAAQPPAPGRGQDPAAIANGKEVCLTRGCPIAASQPAQHAMGRTRKGSPSCSAARRAAREVRRQAAELHPVAGPCGAGDARHRQGPDAGRNSGRRGITCSRSSGRSVTEIPAPESRVRRQALRLHRASPTAQKIRADAVDTHPSH